MACGQTLGSLNAFQRVTTINTSDFIFVPTTDWILCTGLQIRAWLNVLNESGAGVSVRPALQYAEVVTDQPSSNGGRGDWTGTGTVVTTETIHAFGDLNLGTDKQWVRFGIEATSGSAGGVGQADISAMFEVKPCGKVVGDINVAGIEVDATRDVPVSDWFVTVDTNNVRIGYLLQASNTTTVAWYIQTANDTNRPDDPTSLSSSASGTGTGNYNAGNTHDIDISSVTTPATATDTRAYARIMARLSSSSAPEAIDQLVVNVQVS